MVREPLPRLVRRLRLDRNQFRLVEWQGSTYAACSEGCEWISRTWAQAHAGRRQFWARYHGWDLADVILDLGYVRPDGRTPIGQPALDLDRLWTVDDIRAVGYEVKDPLAAVLIPRSVRSKDLLIRTERGYPIRPRNVLGSM